MSTDADALQEAWEAAANLAHAVDGYLHAYDPATAGDRTWMLAMALSAYQGYVERTAAAISHLRGGEDYS